MDKKGMKAAIYCRVANAVNGEMFSIEMQKKFMQNYATECGYTDTVCYLDNGCGGLTFDRPAFSRLNDDIRAGRVSVVMMRDLSRAGRDVVEVAKWINWLEEQGVEFVTADGYQHDDGTFAELQSAFNKFMSQPEKRKLVPLS